MVDSEAAARLAESCIREKISGWTELRYELRELPDLSAVAGGFIFSYFPTHDPAQPGSIPTIVGNMPIRVNPETGECERLGVDEYMRLKLVAASHRA